MTTSEKIKLLLSAGLTKAMIRRAGRNGFDIDKLIALLEVLGKLLVTLLPLFMLKR